MRGFISYWIEERHVEYGNIVHSRRLFQQLIVDCYMMLEVGDAETSVGYK